MSGDTTTAGSANPAETMRQFIMIGRNDSRTILSYIALVVGVTAVSSLICLLTQNGSHMWARELAKLAPERELEPIYDFYHFPCRSEARPSFYLKLHGKCVRTVDKALTTKGIFLDERCQFIPIAKSPSICTYRPLRDGASISINPEGLRNKKEIEAMVPVLAADQKMTFFDVSNSGDGSFCIAAAFVNKNTICMNGNYKTLQMIDKSLVNNRMLHNATYIWNVLDGEYRTWVRHYYDDDGDDAAVAKTQAQDGTFKSFSSLFFTTRNDQYRVNGVSLDDLFGVFRGRTVFMRVELDSVALSVLKNGGRFFRVVDVRILHVTSSNPDELVLLAVNMTSHGFLPYSDVIKRNFLLETDTWPNNVYFVR